MQIDWWTLGLQAVNVLFLIWCLTHFLFRPVAAMVARRQAEIGRLMTEAEAAKAASLSEHAAAAAETTRLANAHGDIMKAAAVEAERQKGLLLAASRAEIEQLRLAAAAEIDRGKAREAAAAADRASRLAVDIAGKLLTRLPEELLVSSFIDGLAAGVAALPEAARRGIGQDGAPAHLRAARALTAGEVDQCRAALAAPLGRPVDIIVDIDPGLLAGLELETPHAVVRNSLRADLNRIATGLLHHDPAG